MSAGPDDAGVAVTPVGGGVYRVSRADGRARLAYAVAAGDVCWVFIDGRTYTIEVEAALARNGAPARKRQRRHHEAGLAAPMPATVVSVNVAPGDRVSAGDVLIMLEAMKMELPIKAAREGVVRAIACRPGELVQPGVPLLELE